jgi:AbrB family transcriptional regulator (stage V sporulation protein T)
VKATGIVRRIDDLGRIVIPKEIRRTLRIREGDPLEIFVDRDGEVILKKYSPIGELADFAKEYAESLHDAVGHIALICDREAVIAVSGAPKREFLDKRVGSAVEQAMQERQTVRWKVGMPGRGSIAGEDEDGGYFASYVIAPIVTGGEAVGAVILASREGGPPMGEMEAKLAETAAGFLARQMAQ